MVKQPQGVEKRIFYYAIVVPVNFAHTDTHSSVIPIAELITADHSVAKVGNWFRLMRLFYTKQLNIWPTFTRIVSDMSFVNLHAICSELNDMTFIAYMEYCYAVVTNNVTTNDKVVVISLCCAHKIKNIANDVHSVFSKKSFEARVIIEIMASFIKINSMEHIKDIFYHLAVILRSRYTTQKVKDSLKLLIPLVSDENFDELALFFEDKKSEEVEDKNEEEFKKAEHDKKSLYKRSPFYKTFSDIISVEKEVDNDQSSEKDEINKYFSNTLLDVLMKKHISYLFLWSGILNSSHNR